MTTIDFSGIALAVSALGTLVTAIGIAVVAVMTARQKRAIENQKEVLAEVRHQGNSVALELKRNNMVFSRRLATETRREADIAIADEAQTAYEEAKKQVDEKKPESQ